MSPDIAIERTASPAETADSTRHVPLSYAPSPPLPDGRRRNETIDVIRLIAAAGIIYVHAVRSPELISSRNLFRFAVPFYLFASIYFQSLSLRRKPDAKLGPYVLGRVKRLYLPFLAWSAIYLLARDAKRLSEHAGPVKLEWGQLWRGTEYHLWFLPFLLAGSIVLGLIHWSALRQDRRWRWPLIALAIAGGLAFAFARMPSSWNQDFDNPTYGFVQNWRAMPALCWAFAFAWFMTMGPVVYSVSIAAGIGGILLTLYCSVWQVIKESILLVPRGLSGLGAMVAALAPWSGPWISPLARLGRYSYGIYLCHVLIGEFVRAAASHRHLQSSPGVDMLIFASSVAGSFIVVLALASSRWTAWLNG